MTATPTERTAEWGHWAITFSTHAIENGRRSYAPLAIHGSVHFPIGTRGPVDQPRRAEYLRMIAEWKDHGALPAELVRVAS
jgi:hypothetical protein